MYNVTLKVLEEIEKHGFKAYVVGGYARDKYLGRKSADVDICTNATPMDLKKIFKNAIKHKEQYGSVMIIVNDIIFEITTFRKEEKYLNYRVPSRVSYIDSLEEDLKRRDFIINTLCINKNGEFIDLLGARKDIDNKIIRSVGSAKEKLNEDILRSLRAIRFSTILDFEIDDELKKYIKTYKMNLKKLSYYRKKEELDKIFSSTNKIKGIQLLIDLELIESLGIEKLNSIVITSDAIGIWAQLDVEENYMFTKNEKNLIKKIKELLKLKDINNELLYKYGLYTSIVASEIMKNDINIVKKMYMNLPIKTRSEIKISANEICEILNIKPSYKINNIYEVLEKEILNKQLENDNNKIKKFIKQNML